LDWKGFGDIFAIIAELATFVWWLFVGKKNAETGKKWLRILFLVLAVVGAIWLVWRLGWLDWLMIKLVLPIWLIILIVFALPALFAVTMALIGDDIFQMREKYFTLYGARWVTVKGRFRYPPICDKCLMEMRKGPEPPLRAGSGPVQVWECRQCGHRIDWYSENNGDLLDDVTARFNAKFRHDHKNYEREI
jgi:hypothetical protein